jgi:hypothetical protein
MSTHRFVVVASLPVLLAASAPKHARPELLPIARAATEPDACALLTESDVSAALEVKSLPGKHPVETSTKMCSWSDAGSDINHRRVVVSITSTDGFNFVKSRSGKIIVEPVSGIGDDAFYQMTKSTESPFLFVKKGNSAFSVRILNGLKLKAFTREEEKSKEAALAKAAVARF